VTFHYWDPSATSVQIKGEWYFSSPAGTTTTSSQGLLPSQWSPGDFPIDYPNAPAANWPVITMTKSWPTGAWTYTTPLPSGTFTYGFFVNCSSPTQTGCTEISDPSNPPWNTQNGTTTGSVEPTSQVYVPSDPAFDTVDYSWQARNDVHGSLVDVTYSSPESISPPGTHPLAVYFPPGYKAHQATPYPTLYLSHGYGGNEVDWTTQGDATNILDNLIDTGQIQPIVVVMTDFNGFPGDCLSNPAPWVAAYDQDLIDNVIPYVQAHYDVSSSVSERAFAGLSCGGGLANSLLYNDTSEFGYFGVMSPYPGVSTPTATQVTALQKVGILVGGGWQDPIHSYVSSEVATLEGNDVGVFPDFVNGGHEWYVWRILLDDFLTRVAFFPVLG
jgi:enterochelin esterase-like enzyme